MIAGVHRADKTTPWLGLPPWLGILPAVVVAVLLAACQVLAPPPTRPAPLARAVPAPPLSPFADLPIFFMIRGHFVRGEQVVVRVCLRADQSIDNTSIVESSGDPRFDEQAVDWARRARLRTGDPRGRAVARCGLVHVELRDPGQPAVGDEVGEQLG
jgi:TonB family protein